MRSLGWVLIQSDWDPYKNRRLGHRHTQRDDHLGTQTVVTYKPRREASEEISPADTLILDF